MKTGPQLMDSAMMPPNLRTHIIIIIIIISTFI